MYKLVVCDIDGTLVDKAGNLSRRTIDVIDEVRAQGVYVTLCTGRNIAKTVPIAKKLKIDIPYICIDGILMVDPVKNKVINDFPLAPNHVEELVALGKENGTFIEVSDGYKYYKHIPEKSFRKYDFFNKHNFQGRVKSYLNGIRYVKTPEDLTRIPGPVYQVVIGAETGVTEKITREVLLRGYENIEVRDFLWEEFLFINYKGIGKSHGVKQLCRHLDVSPEEVIAFGDERNDLDMLKFAGLGVAMANAGDSVKAVSDRVTRSNEENGVAYALEKLILEGGQL